MSISSDVSKALRAAAELLRIEGLRPGYSQYICDTLGHGNSRPSSTLYLYGLGMGRGFGEFGWPQQPGSVFTEEQQFTRVMWLHFAADLADELGDKWVNYVVALSTKEST